MALKCNKLEELRYPLHQMEAGGHRVHYGRVLHHQRRDSM